MKLKFLVYTLLVSLSFLACKGEQKAEVAIEKTATGKVFDEVMVIHDDVMPMIADVHREKKRLKSLMETIVDKDQKEAIEKSIFFLTESNDAMMTWMAELDSNKKNQDNQDAIDYFLKEKIAIDKISRLIKTSIANAKKIN